MSKNRSSSKAFCADDSTQKSTHDDHSSFSTKNIACDEVQLSDSLASCSGGSENKVDCGTSNNATEGVAMFPELTAQKMVVDEHVSCNLPSNETMGRDKDQIVLGADASGDGSLIASKGGLQVHATPDTSDPLRDTKVSLDRSNSQASSVGPLFQCDGDVKQSTDCLSLSDRDEKAYESNGPDQLTEINRCPPISSQEAELDSSDLEEQDVKVCDICGDAGREDLLAICNRCTDGAEHTYCMREMLDKVPEGNWLCEECKSNEETVKQRQVHPEILVVKERTKQTSNSLAKLRKKDSSSGAIRADNDSLARRLQTKRRGSDMVVDPAAKRQVLESTIQSPSVSSPGKNSAPFRDNSFKNLDKMNVKLLHQTSIGRSEGAEKPWSPNGSHVKGSFLKSNSFGSSSSKPKVKMVDEVPQKHRQGADVKDGFSKHVSKAMSLKGSLSRSNTTETKVKMLSPKDSHILESRGLKQPKDRALFDRKNSFKIDHSSVSQVVTDGSKNQVRGDVKRQSSSHLTGVSSSINSASGCVDLRTNVPLKEGCSSTLSQLDGLDISNDQPKQGAGIGVANGSSRSSALDTSSVRSLKDGTNEENKLKAAIQAAMQKRLDMCKRKSTETSVSNTHLASETASSDRPNSMLSGNPMPAKEIHEAEAASLSCTFSSGPVVSDKNVSISKGFPAGSMVYPLTRDSAAVSSNFGRVLTKSAIPEHEFSWLGSFEVYRDGNSPEHISGIQAHISTCASHKVIEMVKKFPQKVSLNEVPRSRTWPTQFQDGAAGEDNVAVYFFARDVDSYERSYKNLLEKMMKDDLALKGDIDGFELLIFPSKQLIKSSQRWNMLFFIWGVFRGRTGDCQANKSDYKEKLDLYSFNKNRSVTSDFKCPSGKISPYGSAKENISTAESAQGVVRDNVIASVFVSGEQSVSLSNGDCDLEKRSPHPMSSYGKFGHRDGINNSLSTCYHPEVELKKVGISQGLSSTSLESRVSSATTFLFLGTGARDADVDSFKIAKSQIFISPGGGRNTCGRAGMTSCDPIISQGATILEGSSEKQTASNIKDNRQMKTQDPLKDKGCQMEHEGDLNIEAASGVNEPGLSKLEESSGHEERHKETNNSRREVDMDCELMHVVEADGEKRDFERSKSSIRATKMGDASDQLWPRRDPPQDVCKNSFECTKLSDMSVALGGVDEGMKRGAESSSLFSQSSAAVSTTASDPCGSSSPSEKTYNAVSDNKEMRADGSSSVETERFFFPVASQPANLGWSVAAAAAAVSPPSSSSSGIDHSPSDGFPSLELALGVENKRTKAGLYLGSIDSEGEEKRKKEDEEAALSLSLAFPFANKGGGGVCVRGGTTEQERGPDK